MYADDNDFVFPSERLHGEQPRSGAAEGRCALCEHEAEHTCIRCGNEIPPEELGRRNFLLTTKQNEDISSNPK
ncbi:MAG: hypothetical protein DMG97_37910 [Acidobacteria bacterium]|jgi:hypothetical protein|nr:MAG: hypothetical protein DMG97_37910 [Acidobacteriota bacterium]PYX59100.1 MAG: hypothetical protein DMG76_06750 [Acidobacteriota bacterium]